MHPCPLLGQRHHLRPKTPSTGDNGSRALGGSTKRIVRQMAVSMGRRRLRVAQQRANDRQREAARNQYARETVTQIVQTDTRQLGRLPHCCPRPLISVRGVVGLHRRGDTQGRARGCCRLLGGTGSAAMEQRLCVPSSAVETKLRAQCLSVANDYLRSFFASASNRSAFCCAGVGDRVLHWN